MESPIQRGRRSQRKRRERSDCFCCLSLWEAASPSVGGWRKRNAAYLLFLRPLPLGLVVPKALFQRLMSPPPPPLHGKRPRKRRRRRSGHKKAVFSSSLVVGGSKGGEGETTCSDLDQKQKRGRSLPHTQSGQNRS